MANIVIWMTLFKLWVNFKKKIKISKKIIKIDGFLFFFLALTFHVLCSGAPLMLFPIHLLFQLYGVPSLRATSPAFQRFLHDRLLLTSEFEQINHQWNIILTHWNKAWVVDNCYFLIDWPIANCNNLIVLFYNSASQIIIYQMWTTFSHR